MEDFLLKLPGLVEQVCFYLGALVLVATVVVRFTPSKTDDELVSKLGRWFYRMVDILPTLGVNPKTKKLKDAYEKLRG